MVVVFIALIAIIPVIEIALIITIASAIGLWPTVALLALGSLLGAGLLKKQSPGAWRAFKETARRGQIPAREGADGGLIISGGLLLLIPGFFTDAIGLFLMIPQSRRWVRVKVLKADQLHENLANLRLPNEKPDYDIDGSVIEDYPSLTEKAGQ